MVTMRSSSCGACPLQARCTTSAHGRSIAIHPDERLLSELRERQLTPTGRAKLRERVPVEHCLAHIGHWQGLTSVEVDARYPGGIQTWQTDPTWAPPGGEARVEVATRAVVPRRYRTTKRVGSDVTSAAALARRRPLCYKMPWPSHN